LNLTIPFSKDILFKTKIAEIFSISLEQDVSINEKELLGDFIVSGDYKSLDINVDTTPFSYVVPFSVSLDEDIDINTLKYEICDFKYNIVGEDTLNVVISFHVEADKIINKHEELFERIDENEELSNDDIDKIIQSDVDDNKNHTLTLDNDDDIFEDEKVIDQRLDNQNDSADIISQNELEEDYITYHIHLVKINETIDSISSDYKIDKDVLMELNDVNSINIGDKLIIPINNETD